MKVKNNLFETIPHKGLSSVKIIRPSFDEYVHRTKVYVITASSIKVGKYKILDMVVFETNNLRKAEHERIKLNSKEKFNHHFLKINTLTKKGRKLLIEYKDSLIEGTVKHYGVIKSKWIKGHYGRIITKNGEVDVVGAGVNVKINKHPYFRNIKKNDKVKVEIDTWKFNGKAQKMVFRVYFLNDPLFLLLKP